MFTAALVATHDTLDVLVLVDPLRRPTALGGVSAGGGRHLELPEARPRAQGVLGSRGGDDVVSEDGGRLPPRRRHQGHTPGESQVQRLGGRPGRTQDPRPTHRQGVVRKNNGGGGRERATASRD